MIAQHLTNAERLARIEALLEEKVIPEIASIRADVANVKTAVDADVKDLGNLKQKGGGILVGVGLAATAFGATLTSHWKEFLQSLQ
jgi:predicted NUDIX family NTP pyrophosphohydrolase